MLRNNELNRLDPRLKTAIKAAINEVIESGHYILGPKVETFERQFAEFCGTSHAIGVANGSDALEVSLKALNVGQGDRVATVANAGGYATFAILNAGAEPVFCDVDPQSMTMDPQSLEQIGDADCRAIIVTHLYGRLAATDKILAIANRKSIPVIEDCAQSHGAGSMGNKAGSRGIVGCFSFYPTKNLGALGDGGVITTSDTAIAESLRSLRQYGWSKKYEVTRSGGRNSRLDEVQAAILSVKLPHLDSWNQRRLEIAQAFSTRINHPLIELPETDGPDYIAHLFVVRTKRRDSLRAHLHQCAVSSEVHYPIPDHRQPILQQRFAGVRLPATESLASSVLSLPCFPEMSAAEIALVIDSCNSWNG